MRRRQNVFCLSRKLEGVGGICCISHPWVGRSLEGCECIIWGSIQCGWRSAKVHWQNVFCAGIQPSTTSLDTIYFKSSLGWPFLAHYSGFHHDGYERGPPHCNDRHEQVRFILNTIDFKVLVLSCFQSTSFEFLTLCIQSWNSLSILLQPPKSIEFDHIKLSMVHDFFHTQSIGVIPLVQFKDVINLDVYKRCENKSRKTWYFMMQEMFLDYM